MTGRTTVQPVNNLPLQSAKFFLWKSIWGGGITWSYLRKSRPVSKEVKVVVVVVVILVVIVVVAVVMVVVMAVVVVVVSSLLVNREWFMEELSRF